MTTTYVNQQFKSYYNFGVFAFLLSLKQYFSVVVILLFHFYLKPKKKKKKKKKKVMNVYAYAPLT